MCLLGLHTGKGRFRITEKVPNTLCSGLEAALLPIPLALRPAIVAGVLVLTSLAIPGGASAEGLAFDSVMKFQQGGDGPPQPGNFSSDFEAASTPQEPAKRGPFGLGAAMAQAQATMSMFKTGIAERHYVAGWKTRTDHIALNTAEILDCSARTLTTLDLAAKTYSVESLDHPYQPSRAPSGPSAPRTVGTDDGTKMTIALTTRALGTRTIENLSTSGYSSDVKTTVTKPGSDPQSFDMNTIAYFSTMNEPAATCPSISSGGTPSAPGAGAMAAYQSIMTALRNKTNPRFSISESGPSLPAGKFALFEVVTMQGQGRQGGGFATLTERGDVHSISDNDPAFGIPPGFTKVSH